MSHPDRPTGQWKPQDASSDPAPHAAYIAAVANALEAFGIPVGDIRAEVNDPLDGLISPAPPIGADEDSDAGDAEPGKLLFVWSGERGWEWGRLSYERPGDLAFTRPLGDQALPPRDVIAAEMAATARGNPPPSQHPHALPYRSFDDEDGFGAQLAAYADEFEVARRAAEASQILGGPQL